MWTAYTIYTAYNACTAYTAKIASTIYIACQCEHFLDWLHGYETLWALSKKWQTGMETP